MMFGEKLKKLRLDNHLTQDELAEKILVTRTAVSKWETNKGYPSIDSLKQLSNLFGISIDELIADNDIENKRLLDQAKSRKYYWYAIICLGITTILALVSYFAMIPYLNFLSLLGVIGYIIFAFISSRYKRLSVKKMIVPYIMSRIGILAVVIIVMITTIMQM